MTEPPHIRDYRRAAVTITAADPDGLQANQGFNVTVEAAATNNAPVAQGTIPGSSLAIGGTSTIDAAGYFSDADGDELTYTGASSNEGVATVSMDGSSATITAVAAGDAVITITASDGSASASQGFTVTVAAAPRNNPPVAVGTIPGSSLAIGGSSTIDAAGYFSDADGDELTYTGSSSNEAVATVAMDGSSATITAVAAGDAVITITASDGSASVSQGFRVDVNAGPKAATVVISRLLDENRNQISDPTGISGTIYAVLDVQSNDETWNEIGLTLNGETVTPMCRGSASADVAVGPGLAAAGQVEIECRLQTNAVEGECVGMPLDPMYANGAYELGAFLTTDADARREVVATQPIALKNSNFVTIAHVPGNRSEVGTHTDGLTFYGGPSTAEGNANMFHACPVAYDGTEVGKMQLGSMLTDTARPDPNPVDGPRVSFRNPAGGSYYPSIEAPFTWTISTAHNRTNNHRVENVPGETEHWIVNDGQILDPNGLDISASFRSDGMAKYGPLHFDFKAPVAGEGSEVVIAAANVGSADWVSTAPQFYRASGGSSARRFRITDLSDMGVGHVYGTTSAIAVGDWSAGTNADTRASTAFTALEGLENVTHVSQLPEEDARVDGVADGGGVDTYVAEVQSIADRLGNSTWLGSRRIRSATHFGVDHTGPEISRERPSESLVLSTNMLYFEVEDPRLATGEDGSGLTRSVIAWAGGSAPNSSSTYWTGSATVDANGVAAIDITPGTNARFAREASHTVFAWTPDEAGNGASTSFTFVRDQTPPDLSLSAVPSNFGSTTAKSVSVTVAGTLNDATEIRRAFLSIHEGATCTAADPLEGSQVSGPVRRLDNGTNMIEFSEVFTVKQGDHAGPTTYCFFLTAEDDARDADDRAFANAYNASEDRSTHGDVISTFAVGWPEGEPPPPPGPTFEFMNVDGTDIDGPLEVTEGDVGTMYAVKLDIPEGGAAPTATAPLSVDVEGSSGVNVSRSTLTWPTDVTDATADTLVVTVTTAHDLDIVDDPGSVSHSATGYDDATLPVLSKDEDYAITVDVASINEDDGPTEVTVTVTGGVGPSSDAGTFEVTIGPDTNSGADAADFEGGSPTPGTVTVPIAAGMVTGSAKVMIDAADDVLDDEANERITLTGPRTDPNALTYFVPASIMIVDDDPDVTLALDVTEVNEDAGTVTVEITATADAPVDGITTFTLALTGTATSGTDYVDPGAVTLRMDARATTGSTSVTLAITDDADDESNETIIFDDADGAVVGAKTYSVSPVTLTIIDNDDT